MAVLFDEVITLFTVFRGFSKNAFYVIFRCYEIAQCEKLKLVLRHCGLGVLFDNVTTLLTVFEDLNLVLHCLDAHSTVLRSLK